MSEAPETKDGDKQGKKNYFKKSSVKHLKIISSNNNNNVLLCNNYNFLYQKTSYDKK